MSEESETTAAILFDLARAIDAINEAKQALMDRRELLTVKKIDEARDHLLASRNRL